MSSETTEHRRRRTKNEQRATDTKNASQTAVHNIDAPAVTSCVISNDRRRRDLQLIRITQLVKEQQTVTS